MTRFVMGFEFDEGFLFETERICIPKTEPKSKRYQWKLRVDGKDKLLNFVAMDEKGTRYFSEGFLDPEKMCAILDGEIFWLKVLEEERGRELLY